MTKHFHIALTDEQAVRNFPLRAGNNRFFGSLGGWLDPAVGFRASNGYVIKSDPRRGTVRFKACWIDENPIATSIPAGVAQASAQTGDFEWPARVPKIFRWGRPTPVPLPDEPWRPEPRAKWTDASTSTAARIKATRESAVGPADPGCTMFEHRAGFWQPYDIKIGYAQGGRARNPFVGWEGSLELYIQQHDAVVERLFCDALGEDGLPLSAAELGNPQIDMIGAGGPWLRHNQLPWFYQESGDTQNQHVVPIAYNSGVAPGRDPIFSWEFYDDQHLINGESIVYAAFAYANDPLATITMHALAAQVATAWTTTEIQAWMPSKPIGTGTFGRAIAWQGLCLSREGENRTVSLLRTCLTKSQMGNKYWQRWPSSVYGFAPDPWRGQPPFNLALNKAVAQSIEHAMLLVLCYRLGVMSSFRSGANAWLFGRAIAGAAAAPHFIVTGKDGAALSNATEAVGTGQYADSYTPWWILGLGLLDAMEGNDDPKKWLRKMLGMVAPGEGTLHTKPQQLLDALINSAYPEHTCVAVRALEDAKAQGIWK